MKKADSEKAESAVRQVRELTNRIEHLRKNHLRAMQLQTEEELNGEYAEAIGEMLGALSGDIRGMEKNLETVEKALKEYAEALRQADREAAEAIRKDS